MAGRRGGGGVFTGSGGGGGVLRRRLFFPGFRRLRRCAGVSLRVLLASQDFGGFGGKLGISARVGAGTLGGAVGLELESWGLGPVMRSQLYLQFRTVAEDGALVRPANFEWGRELIR